MVIKKANLKFKHTPSVRRKTNQIILHCSGTADKKDYTPADIHSWHLEKGWIGCGYNFIIGRDGTVWECRPENAVGSHCKGHNSYSIGICYIGGLDPFTKQPRDTRTTEQKESMYKLVQYLLDKYHLTIMDVHCHNEYAAKDCPSFQIYDFRDEYLNWINKKMKLEWLQP